VESPQGKLQVQTVLGDYTEVDGIKLPFTLRQAAGPLEFVIKLQEVKHNVPVDDEKFKKPEK
jgi:hypothetical protein